jgi:hypothetical protein
MDAAARPIAAAQHSIPDATILFTLPPMMDATVIL